MRGSVNEYPKFIQNLHGIGYLDYTNEPRDRAGVFFVKKSDGIKQRLMIDGRRANARLVEPPSVRVCTPEAFARIEMEMTAEAPEFSFEALVQEVGFHVGMSDSKDCFHRVIQSRWLGRLILPRPHPGEVDHERRRHSSGCEPFS